MKKLGTVLLATLMIASMASAVVSAAGLVFTDDFSSGNFSKWSNLAIEEGDKADTECSGKATIANSTLTIKNFDPVGSFFYLSPKNIKTKNFTVSMKVKSNTLNDGWIGFSVRKETNDRYNGSTNILFTYRLSTEGSWLGALRGYAGSVADMSSKLTEKQSFTGDLLQYHVFKLVVKDTVFTAYVDDMKIGVLTYDKAATNAAGFMSINACMADVSIKDFKLETEDGVVVSGPTPLPTTATSTSTSTAPTVTNAPGTSSTSKISGATPSVSNGTDSSTGDSSITGSESNSTDSNNSSNESKNSSAITNSSKTSSTSSTGTGSGFPTVPVIIAVVAVLVVGGGIFAYFKFIKK